MSDGAEHWWTRVKQKYTHALPHPLHRQYMGSYDIDCGQLTIAAIAELSNGRRLVREILKLGNGNTSMNNDLEEGTR